MKLNFFKKKTPGNAPGASPDEAFLKNAKSNFLAAFDARHGTRPAVSHFGLVFKISTAAFAAFALIATASVYADSRNVSADSSLYSFKRLGEKVQLVFTPAPQKAQLQASFAARRMDEITDLTTRDPSSTIIPALNTDLSSAIDTTVNEQAIIDQGSSTDNGSSSVQGDFCGRFFSQIGSASSIAHDTLLSHPGIIRRFEERCGQEGSGDGQKNMSDTASATTIIVAGTSTPTSTFHPSIPAIKHHIINQEGDEHSESHDD